jgi:beta-glucosidase/6-phospho-beta-glucosidase/beta-galactosidase
MRCDELTDSSPKTKKGDANTADGIELCGYIVWCFVWVLMIRQHYFQRFGLFREGYF